MDTEQYARKRINSPTVLQAVKICTEEMLINQYEDNDLLKIEKHWLECIELKLENKNLIEKMVNGQKEMYAKKLIKFLVNKNNEVDGENFEKLERKIKNIDGKFN